MITIIERLQTKIECSLIIQPLVTFCVFLHDLEPQLIEQYSNLTLYNGFLDVIVKLAKFNGSLTN